ncbi:MAG: type II toxin-antitoxin system prevent-host-death family antitoxin [Cycloclasticus sp.]|nr:type II toxin-antitoxin system prevent-host-death family antitoxin [Cycloclasticus sp.]
MFALYIVQIQGCSTRCVNFSSARNRLKSVLNQAEDGTHCTVTSCSDGEDAALTSRSLQML